MRRGCGVEGGLCEWIVGWSGAGRLCGLGESAVTELRWSWARRGSGSRGGLPEWIVGWSGAWRFCSLVKWIVVLERGALCEWHAGWVGGSGS